MSGVAGWIDWQRDLSGKRDVLRSMTDAIRHRGPDDEGHWLFQVRGDGSPPSPFPRSRRRKTTDGLALGGSLHRAFLRRVYR